jgi:hypothetical protein
MINQYNNAVKQIGLTQEDADAVLSNILSEYRRLDGRVDQGVDWVDIISEILDEKNLTHKYAPNRKYLIVAVNGCLEIQKWVVATTEKEAREKFWLSISDGERNNAESIECIDEENDN